MIQDTLINDLKLKWERLQLAMRKAGADACLLTVDVNVYYTTGRIYSGYFYLPAEGAPRFFVKRPNGLAGEHVEYIRKPEQIAEIFAAKGIKTPEKLLLEVDEISYNDYIRLKAIFNPKEMGNASTLLRTERMIKTPWEIEQFRISARHHALTYAEIPSCFRPGMTDLDFQYEIERLMRKNGSIGLFRAYGNMDIFMGSILAGENAETPSPYDFALGGGGINSSAPIGANGTPLKEGISVMVDMAGNFTTYMTDMTRTFSIGKLPDLAYRAHQVSLDIIHEVQQTAKPGTPCANIYNKALEMAGKAGLSPYFMGTKQQAKFVGHGIGIQINEPPVLTSRSKDLLSPNMVIAIEPKFVLPDIGAVGIEDSFLVTESALEQITHSPEEIINLL
ncbi:peptidase M24 [Bacteroidia bacterium]|nr:peptidase M24 [Bacteroidia bacterium]